MELSLIPKVRATVGVRSFVGNGGNLARPKRFQLPTAGFVVWGHTSGSGQSRHFGRRQTTSGLPPEADIVTAGRHVSKVP